MSHRCFAHNVANPTRSVWLLLVAVCMLSGGCSSGPAKYGKLLSRAELRATSPDVAFRDGKPHPVLDRMRRVVEVPQRVLHGGKLPDQNPPEETRELLADYMQQNHLTQVSVFVNDYDPAGEWRRLRSNDRIHPVWRYSAGLLSVAKYTLAPGYVLGRDHYNPFTNSLSINSNRLSDALREAAYAKDIQRREQVGTYAVVTSFPVLRLWKQTRAARDIIEYARAADRWELERDVYRGQYPQMAAQTTFPVGIFLSPLGNVALGLGGGAVGYGVGRTVESNRLRERDEVESSAESKPSVELVGHKVED